MVGTSKSKAGDDKEEKQLDAPRLPTEPGDSTAPDPEPSLDPEPVAAQAQPMDEQETPSTPDAEGEPAYLITLDMSNVPKVGDYELVEGQHDPSLVTIPGLGQFQNGTTTKIDEVQLALMSTHFSVTGITEMVPPAGVTIEKEGK